MHMCTEQVYFAALYYAIVFVFISKYVKNNFYGLRCFIGDALFSLVSTLISSDTSVVPQLWHRTIAGKSTCGRSDALPWKAHMKHGNYDEIK